MKNDKPGMFASVHQSVPEMALPASKGEVKGSGRFDHPNDFASRQAKVHRCQACGEDKGDTPLSLAFRLMGIKPDDEYTIVFQTLVMPSLAEYDNETWFDRGWDIAHASANEGLGVTPFNPDEPNGEFAMLAWLVGLSTGLNAAIRNWATASCRFADPAAHIITSLPLYMQEVERVGEYPAGCLGINTFTRGLMQVCMDNAWTPRDAASAVTQLLAIGKIDDLPTPEPRTDFDPNPTVFRPDQPGAYDSYIKGLDKSDPTWFWYKYLDHMAPEIEKAAIQRRLNAVGEQGHQGS